MYMYNIYVDISVLKGTNYKDTNTKTDLIILKIT
jgi:hypothetical protein